MTNANILLSNNKHIIDGANNIYEINETINAIATMATLNNQSCLIVDFDSQKVVFKSDYLIFIEDTIKTDIKRECSNPYWALISDKTFQIMLSLHKNFWKMRENLKSKEYAKSISTIDFPIFIKGKEFFIHQRYMPLTFGQDGLIKHGLFIFSNSNKTRIEGTIHTPSGRRWNYDLKREIFYEDKNIISLTPLEKSILLRIQKGMNSKEIADMLFVSINTIKTHRMRIFKKLGVGSMTEALVVLKNYHIL